MARAIEITTFKLKSGFGIDDFVKANSDVDPWLRRQRGFVSRTMVERSDGTIVDMVIWESAAEAEDSAQRLMRELASSPVHSVIDERTVSWSIGRIFRQSA